MHKCISGVAIGELAPLHMGRGPNPFRLPSPVAHPLLRQTLTTAPWRSISLRGGDSSLRGWACGRRRATRSTLSSPPPSRPCQSRSREDGRRPGLWRALRAQCVVQRGTAAHARHCPVGGSGPRWTRAQRRPVSRAARRTGSARGLWRGALPQTRLCGAVIAVAIGVTRPPRCNRRRSRSSCRSFD